MDNDSIDRLDIRVIKTMLADLTVDIESIKETIESLEQNNEDVDTKLTDISSSLEILLQNAEID
jgi:chaperonin cofactor prefoldin